ncbi:MAG TPA: hypothetical protein VFA41_19895 [Ktedonobacteraceae bacterium]|jgi:hypothetical protein|nr:hypothetical protein [Ktedonobacteraceae bacterium]
MTIYQDKNSETIFSEEADQARRQAIRENAKRVLQESGLSEMLKTLNKNVLKGRGSFQEFDSMILMRWGTSTTRRHIWVEIDGNTIRFRLTPHLQCTRSAPLCDGEYHTFTSAMWADRNFLLAELNKYYQKPVAETSSD